MARLDDRRRERRLVGRVGEVLRLEAEPEPVAVHRTALAGDRAVEEVPRVELHARLRRRDVHDAAGGRLAHRDDAPERAGVAVEHPVVVVALAVRDLLVLRVDAGADRGGGAEVERRALHRPQLAGRDEGGVDRREPVGLDADLVLQHVAGALPGQVEVGVVRHVGDRLGIARQVVVDPELVLLGHRVGDRAP